MAKSAVRRKGRRGRDRGKGRMMHADSKPYRNMLTSRTPPRIPFCRLAIRHDTSLLDRKSTELVKAAHLIIFN
jgi:hypothetical protein